MKVLHANCQILVGARRFELPTYGTQNRRATRLRYAPNRAFLLCFAAIEKPLERDAEKGSPVFHIKSRENKRLEQDGVSI